MGQIDKFRAAMGKAKGFARPSKFAVRINPPGAISGSNLNELHQSMRGQINLFCNSVEMPGHDLQTVQQQHGSAPARDIVQAHAFEGMITASFYLSEDLRERHYFEQWQKLAVDTETHKANYYDTYTGEMEIYQLSTGLDSGLPFPTFIDKIFDVDKATYGILAREVYPATISGIEYSYDNGNQIATMAVGFNYREWRNLGDKDSGLRPYS